MKKAKCKKCRILPVMETRKENKNICMCLFSFYKKKHRKPKNKWRWLSGEEWDEGTRTLLSVPFKLHFEFSAM